MEASTISNYGGTYWFDPIGLYVPSGTALTWHCGQGAPHTATAYPDRVPEAAEPFESPYLATGQTFTYRFDVRGVYDYYCIPHRAEGMVGRVVCGEPDESHPGQPPDGTVPSVTRILDAGRVAASDL